MNDFSSVQPSHSVDAEHAILSAAMRLPDDETMGKIFRMLSASDFYIPQHRAIWQAMTELRLKGITNDPVMIAEQSEGVEFDYAIEIARSFISAANLMQYTMIVRERAQERAAVGALHETIAMLTDKSAGTFTERLAKAERKVVDVLSVADNGRSGLVSVKDIAKNWIRELSDRVEGNAPVGFGTGIRSLDAMLAPKHIPKGSLVVVGARPKMGKSALMTFLLDNFCQQGLQNAVFSMEMPSGQVWERMVSGGSGVTSSKFYTALSSEDYRRVTDYTTERMAQPLYFDDSPGMTVGHIKSECRKMARKGPVGLIAVDYLTLMDADKSERNDLAYGKITKELKRLARELECVVLLLTQLNRSIESKPIKERKPMPADSRDTGQIEQDCDLWIGLYRAGAYEPQVKFPNLTHLLVRLNRHGKTGHVYLNMGEGYFTQLDNVEGQAQEETNNKLLDPPKAQRSFAG
jgi:replicative DNA helicase